MSDGPVQIYASADAFEAELIKGRLEGEGIAALLKGEGEGPYRAGAVYVWVGKEDETAARAIVDIVRSGALELDPSGDDADVEA